MSAVMADSARGMGQKVFSVDDLVGGFFGRLGHAHSSTSGFPRTDSEAAFQEFLKRIPSASNLAAVASQGQLDGASAAQLAQQNAGASAAMLPSISIGDLSGAAGSLGGMPRVPSLDFLKQLSAMQSMAGMQPQGIKIEAPAPGAFGSHYC